MRKAAYIIPGVLLLWAGVFSFAHASVAVEQLNKTTQQALCNSTCYETLNALGETSSTPDYDLTGDISYMTVHAASAGSADRLNISLWDNTAGSWATGCGVGRPNPGLVLSTEGDYTCSLGTPYTPVSGHVYRISIFFYTAAGFSSTGYVWGSPDETAWPYGIGDAVNNYDRYFITDTFLNYSPPTDNISITYPAANATSTTPDHFDVSYQTMARVGQTYEIILNTYTNPAFPHGSGLQFVPGSTTTTSTTITASMGFQPNFTYYEQAFLYYWPDANTFQIVASSTPQQFTTGATSYTAPATSTTWVPPTAAPITTSTPTIQITCDPNDSYFAYSLCNMFQAMVIPSPSALQHITDIKDLVVNKPPMGWFNEIVASVQGINTSSTPAFVLISATVITSFHGLFYLLDVGLGVIFVFLAIVWTYHRARKMKL